jgi:septal ring factor EnvC (AmiA/AmiB activator)
MRRLAAVQQDSTPAPGGLGPGPDDTAGLEAAVAALDAELARLDGELKAAEQARDSANHALSEGPAALQAWRLEEQREAAETRITELLELRCPVVERHARLLGHLTPIQQRQREIIELEAEIEVLERLAEVWPHLDAALAAIDAARPACTRSGGRRGIPPSLEEFVRQWGPDSFKRYRCQISAGADAMAGLREQLARLRGGLA